MTYMDEIPKGQTEEGRPYSLYRLSAPMEFVAYRVSAKTPDEFIKGRVDAGLFTPGLYVLISENDAWVYRIRSKMVIENLKSLA